MPLTKSIIVEHVAAELGFNKKESKEIIETLIELIKKRFEKGEDFSMPRFGKFQGKRKWARKGWNPVTEEEMMLEGRRVLTFKVSGKLRDRINDGKHSKYLSM